VADRPVTVAAEDPSEPLPDQLLVDQGIADLDKGNGPAIAVFGDRLHFHHLGEDEGGGSVFRRPPEALPLLRAVDPVKADLFGLSVVEDGNRIAVGYADDLAGPGCGVGK
jgi:hypothetical protein